ncbi:MAG: HD domain-containing protein [Lachnospiraceae bacterium]|nr:HD domain-containing protein [Lachnospiraceae bacterium]
MNDKLKQEISLILRSDVFSRLKGQTHHINTTLDRHIISVALVCKRISSFLKRFNAGINEDELIIAALCHDLGMSDRHDKKVFPTHRDLALKHGERSVYYAREILGLAFTEREEDIVKQHMFPMLRPPRSIEGWILITADKFCTVWDFLGCALNRLPFHKKS